MKKSLAILLLSLIFPTSLFSKVNVIVSIPPQLEFIQKIGGDRINASLMIETGSSPHTYEPKPSQMKAVSQADLYLGIGVEFESSWLPKLKNQNGKLTFYDTSKNIQKIPMQSHHHNCQSHHKKRDQHEHEDEKLDPHVWVSVANVKIIAQNIYDALISIDANNTDYYYENLKSYLKELNELESHIKRLLSEVPKNSTFMVFHPSWGYFAKEYKLHQLAIEIEGKTPKPKQLIQIIKQAKDEKVRVILTQPEFSDKIARIIADELDVKVVKISALEKKWSDNLIRLAQILREANQK